MDEMLFRVFAESVGRYLDAVDRSVVADTPLAMETRRLVAAWRALLRLHQPGRGGRCGGCGRRGGRKAMCGVWRVANAYFVRRLPGEGEVRR
ncbi:MAG TPA: hypothetical protein VNP92_11740 [Actinophytocola sp.]|nr:hypothetical protein [Actinophytocola sp.]